MPALIVCPKCKRKLRVPENLMGKKVKCPSCSTAFTAAEAEEDLPTAPLIDEEDAPRPPRRKPAPPPEEEFEEESPKPRRRPAPPPSEEEEEETEEEEEEERRPRKRRRPRRNLVPHRGGVILTLGIVSFFCFPIILGPIAWTMGNNDMREIRRGRMDRAGEGLTNAGRICGIVTTCLAIVGCLIYGVVFVAALAGGGHR